MAAFLKCGHTSIIKMFLTPPGQEPVERGTPAVRISGPDMPIPPQIYSGIEENAPNWPEPLFTVAFFREPIFRAYSAYQHFIVRTLNVVDGVPTLGRVSFTKLGFTADMSFPEFCEHLCGIDLCTDGHLKPQVTSFNAVVGAGTPYTFRLEHLDTKWATIVDDLVINCTKELAHFNAAAPRFPIDKHVADLVNTLYAEDYEAWLKSGETRTTFPPVDYEVS